MPQFIGETPVYAREVGLAQRFAYVSAGNGAGQIEYQGFAYPGTATSASGWSIRKFAYDSSNRTSTITWASGDDRFNKIWDSRTSYTYS